ncbi:MAG: lipocalin/fatty-acid binding family protein [Myxococcota bacterium]
MRTFLHTFFAASLITLMLSVSPAWAADFSGTWVLDLSASDSPDELLKAQGVSWVKRKAAAKLDVTQNVKQDGDEVTIETVTSRKTKTTTLQVDGETRTVDGDRGKAEVTHAWDGEALVSTSTGPDGGSLVTRRSLSDDGRTLTQRVTLTSKDGSTVSIDRIFRMRE